MQRDDFLSYRETHYHAGSTVISAAGKLRHEDVVESAASLLERIPSRKPIRYEKAPDHSSKPQIASERRDVQQTQLALGFPRAESPRSAALCDADPAHRPGWQCQLEVVPGAPRKREVSATR